MSNKHTFNPIVSDFYKYTVEEFINEVHSVTMADYSFQSRVRWSLENKSSYITSLILGMAPSKFILASTDACKVTSKNPGDRVYFESWRSRLIEYLNIDSNNRVTTIGEYIRGEFGIQPGFYEVNGQVIEVIEGENDRYDTLPNVLLQALKNAVVTVEVITSATRSQLSELFIRMNDGISLNGPEKRNAVISEFSAVIRSLATTYQDTFSKFFTPKDINRRKIDDFIAGLALLYFHGISTKVSDKNLWSAYESGSTEDKLIRKFESDLKNFISFIGDDIGAVPNKNCILDLFLVYKDLNDNNYVVNDRESFFVDYFKAHATSLTDLTTYTYNNGREATYKELLRSREANFNRLRKEIISKLWDPTKYCTLTDSRRNFTKDEKFIASVAQNWVTPEGKPIKRGKLFDPGEYHGGHAKPYADGGATDQENCVVQEGGDNLSLGRNPVPGV